MVLFANGIRRTRRNLRRQLQGLVTRLPLQMMHSIVSGMIRAQFNIRLYVFARISMIDADSMNSDLSLIQH
jgi:hypothetical protein